MAPEEKCVERVGTWPQERDGGSHDDHFKGGERAVEQRSGDDRQPRKRDGEADDCDCNTHNRSEESN